MALAFLERSGARSPRINSAIQPTTKARAGLIVTVTKAVAPITHRHDGRPSNRRREIAKSVPAKISSEPTASIGISARSAAACSSNPTASMSSTAPKIMGARPVRAPKRNCAASPPAPWHIGIAPNGHSTTFARPEVSASRRSLAMAPANGNSSRDRLPVTIRALEG